MRHWSGPMSEKGSRLERNTAMRRNTAILATFLAGGIFFIACHQSEVVAPDGATISLSANPAQIIVQGGQQLAPVVIIATVRDTIGVPLPGQDVRFTTTIGVLTPAASTPVTTDKLGNARSDLNLVTQAAQVTATSGKATASLSLTTATAAICFITVQPSDPQTITDCTVPIDFTVTVEDCSNKPVANAKIVFALDSAGNANAVTGNFQPSTGQTDDLGVVTSQLVFNTSTCNDNCGNSDTTKRCDAQVIIKDQSGLFTAAPVQIVDGIN